MSVPENVEIEVTLSARNWAFGEITGAELR